MAGLDLTRLRARTAQLLTGFSSSQLVIIGLLTVVGLVGGVAFLRWVTAPTYGVLLAGLDAQDASAVTTKLTADGVPYRLAGGGATILIPTTSLDAERLAVASAGLPAGKTDSGWAAFDKIGVTSSSFQQQVAYQRALEAELSDSVAQVQGVRSAQVHLALPEKRLFVEDQQPARASVLVQTSGTLGQDAVNALTHLVASAVPGLSAADVSVTDSSGRLLTQDGKTPGIDSDQQAQTALESSLEARATSLFDTLLGPGHAVVRVNAELDQGNRTIDSETYDPKRTAVLSSSKSEERYRTAAGASPAPLVQPTASPSPAASPGSDGYVKVTQDVQNGVSRTVERQVLGPGSLKRLSVAVAVDRNAPNAPTAAEVQQLVANAVGLNPGRGDTIAVTTPAFLQSGPASAGGNPASAKGLDLRSLAPQVLGGVLLVLVAVGLLRAVRRGSAVDLPEAQVTAAITTAGGRDALPGAPAALPAGAVPAPRQARDGDLLGLLDDNPDEVAGLLRGWLASAEGTDR